MSFQGYFFTEISFLPQNCFFNHSKTTEQSYIRKYFAAYLLGKRAVKCFSVFATVNVFFKDEIISIYFVTVVTCIHQGLTK